MKMPLFLFLVLGFAASGGMVSGLSAQTPAPAPKEVTDGYRLLLRSSSAPHQVVTADDKKRNWFVEPGMHFGGANGKRFLVQKFERKVLPDVRLGEKDASEMIVLDQQTGKTILLVINVEQKVER